MKLEKLVIILGAALFISLSTNLFLAGLMIGETVSRNEATADAADTPAPSPDAKDGKAARDAAGEAEWRKKDALLREKLNDADRSVIEAVKKDRKPVIDGLRKALDDARDKVEAAQAAEPFDADALAVAVKAEAEAKAALVTQMRAGRQEVMQKLSPEGRETLKKFAPWKQPGQGKARRHPPHAPGDAPPPPDAAPAEMSPAEASPATAAPAPQAPDAATPSTEAPAAAPESKSPDYVQPGDATPLPEGATPDGTVPTPEKASPQP